MKISKILYAAMAGAALTFTSCEDFTDVQPKGKNLLSTTDQLEMLLNYEYEGGNSDMRIMAGDMVYALSPLINEISKPTKSRNVIMWTYDEANIDKMAELTSSDNDYTYYYGIIGKISNPILKQMETATGDDAKKKALKSEALTLRAWAYYKLVNKFAKAYNPASAANDPGIIIMTEETDIQTPQPKSTVQEVYDRIIADCDLAIETNGLAPMAVNKMRMNKACPYAVKAQALLSMQRWDEAEAAAKEALAINGVVNDYNTHYKGTMTGYMLGGTYEIIDRGQKGTDEDYFLNPYFENFDSYTPESWAYLENGHAYNKIGNANLMYDNLMDFAQMYIGEAGLVNDIRYQLLLERRRTALAADVSCGCRVRIPQRKHRRCHGGTRQDSRGTHLSRCLSAAERQRHHCRRRKGAHQAGDLQRTALFCRYLHRKETLEPGERLGGFLQSHHCGSDIHHQA